MSATTTAKTTLAMDSSQIVAFRNCPRLWRLSYLEQLGRKYSRKKAFDMGTIVHHLVEKYYEFKKQGLSITDARRESIEILRKIKNAQPELFSLLLPAEQQALITRFNAYCAFYAENDLETVDTEIGFSVPIVDNDEFLFVLEGRIDWLVKLPNGETAFVDHKTQSRKATLYARRVQFMNYAIATQTRTGLVNYISLADKFDADTFRRDLLTYSPAILERHLHWLVETFHRAAVCIAEGYYPQEFNSCEGSTYGPCNFTTICEYTSEALQEAMKKQYYQIRERWTPWAEKEGEEENGN
jgi:hypothetical protein